MLSRRHAVSTARTCQLCLIASRGVMFDPACALRTTALAGQSPRWNTDAPIWARFESRVTHQPTQAKQPTQAGPGSGSCFVTPRVTCQCHSVTKRGTCNVYRNVLNSLQSVPRPPGLAALGESKFSKISIFDNLGGRNETTVMIYCFEN